MTTEAKPNANAGDRRAVLRTLRSLIKLLLWIAKRWDVEGTVYRAEVINGKYNTVRSPRRFSEYPENTAEKWIELVTQTAEMISALEELNEFARQRAEERMGS